VLEIDENISNRMQNPRQFMFLIKSGAWSDPWRRVSDKCCHDLLGCLGAEKSPLQTYPDLESGRSGT